MSQNAADKINQTLLRVAKEMEGYCVREFARSIRKKKIEVTGEFLGSLTSEVQQIDGGYMVISRFRAYGNIITRSRVFWTKPANAYEIAKWVKKVGVDYFSYVPGYGAFNDASRFNLDEDKAAMRIASAIAWQRAEGSKRREYGKMRAQNWKKEPFGRGRAYAGHLTREQIAIDATQIIAKALTEE